MNFSDYSRYNDHINLLKTFVEYSSELYSDKVYIVKLFGPLENHQKQCADSRCPCHSKTHQEKQKEVSKEEEILRVKYDKVFLFFFFR